jgi:hypothetical protein
MDEVQNLSPATVGMTNIALFLTPANVSFRLVERLLHILTHREKLLAIGISLLGRAEQHRSTIRVRLYETLAALLNAYARSAAEFKLNFSLQLFGRAIVKPQAASWDCRGAMRCSDLDERREAWPKLLFRDETGYPAGDSLRKEGPPVLIRRAFQGSARSSGLKRVRPLCGLLGCLQVALIFRMD